MRFVDAGTIGGEPHVDVLGEGGDPLAYGLTLAEARETYGDRPVLTVEQEAAR